MNAKQRDFLKLYVGRNSRYHGNATRCYMKAYDCDNERVAQTSGSRLTKLPEIAAAIETARQKALDNLGADAAFVLEQSIRLYDRAMGDMTVEVDVIDKVKRPVHDEDGEVVDHEIVHVPRAIEVRRYDPAIAHKTIELIGRHTTIQAFQDNVEHTHTHRLERALAARHQKLEAQAGQRDPIEGTARQVPDDDDQAGAPAGAGASKEGASTRGPQIAARAEPEKTSAESAGATGK